MVLDAEMKFSLISLVLILFILTLILVLKKARQYQILYFSVFAY